MLLPHRQQRHARSVAVAAAAAAQPTLQVTAALLLTSLLTFVRPISFSLACLASVFVLVLHILLVQTHHVGTQLLAAASLLGSVWSGIAAAGIAVSVAMQLPSRASQMALLVVLGSTGLALGCLVRVSARQFPQLFLQGTKLLMAFGMSVVLSFFAPSLSTLWSTYLAHMLLAFTAASLASVVSGLLVLPSLATADALHSVITALNRTGQTSTMCVSILLAPLHLLGSTGSKPGDPLRPPPPSQQQQQHQQQQEPQQQVQLSQQPSLLLESPLSASELGSIVERASQPGQWGLRSFLAANSSAATGLQGRLPVGHNARAPSSSSSSSSSSGGGPGGSSSSLELAGAANAAGLAAPGLHPAGPAAAPAPTAPAEDEDDDAWGALDQYEEDGSTTPTDMVSADANVQLSGLTTGSSHTGSSRARSVLLQAAPAQPVAAAAAVSSRPAAPHSGSSSSINKAPAPDLQSHPLMRLQRGVDHIRPLLTATRQLQGAVAVEQAWWVGLLVRHTARPVLDAGAWQKLVDALDALVMRIAALESMLEGGHDYASLARLTSFEALTEACGAVFAQAAALCGATSTQLSAQLAQTQQQGDLVYALRRCCSGSSSSSSQSAASNPAPQHVRQTAGSACTTTATATTTTTTTSSSSSTQGATACLCSSACFNWALAKQHLVRVLDGETEQYYAALAQAAAAQPFTLDPARSMTALMFLCVLSLGVVGACEALQAAAQAVLGASGGSSSSDGRAVGVAGSKQASSTHGSLISSSTRLLLRAFLMVDVGLRIWDALAVQLPAACKSWPAFQAQLSDRRFQAGCKAWLACTIALVVIAAAHTRIAFLGTAGPSVFMFGFMSLVFTMRERVESSMEMVIFRVGATVVGACVGHLFMFHPATAYNPYILAAANAFFCLLLVPWSLGQFRLVVVLALLTFASVTLCQYVGCCGAVGSITYLVGRILATGGGALFAMLLNRLLWPWRRNRWAMEEFSRALDIAVVSAGKMYAAEHAHMSAEAASSSSPAAASATTAAAAEASSGSGLRSAAEAAHVAVELPSSSTAAAASGPAAAASGPASGLQATAALASKSPEQLQQLLGSVLMPVQISIARDTWLAWKRGALALTPSVPLMLSAVQQLLDALSALSITHKLTTNTNTSTSSSPSSRSSAECVAWQQQLLVHELVQPMHSSFSGLLAELSLLVQLVQAHVRQPTQDSRARLADKIESVHAMRVAVSLEWVQLRNQRHRKMRQQLAALWRQQQQQQEGVQAAAVNSSSGVVVGGFEHHSAVLSTVQYVAFVHALRRFFDRAVAVARCALDAQF